MAYVVSAHKPTSVRHAVCASFLSPSSKNLILACSNVLQIYDYDPSTAQCSVVREHSLHGTIKALAVHKPAGYDGQDHLFILTDNHTAFTCSWDPSSQSLRNETLIEGLYDSTLRPAAEGHLVRLDPGRKCIGLSLYQGFLTFILINQIVPTTKRKTLSLANTSSPEGAILENASLRIKHLNLINFVFLRTEGFTAAGTTWPTLAVLWKDDQLRRFVSVWEVTALYKASDRDFVEKFWANGVNSALVDQGANLLIPTNNGGVIVVGEQTISYHSMTWDTFECVIPHPAIFECFTPVDSDDGTEEWILGDSEGRIYSLNLFSDDHTLTITKLGDSKIPSTLVSLDTHTLFLGSHFADSILLSTTPTLHPTQTIITNLAPISDFLVLPPTHPQAGALITCSGGFGQGTLRVVRHGIGIEDYAAVDLPGIRGVWTLRTPQNSTVLVLGMISRTVFLEIDPDGGLEAVDHPSGLVDTEETIALKQVGSTVVQVTTARIHVTEGGNRRASLAARISAVRVTGGGVLAASGRKVVLLDWGCDVLRQWTVEEEITCLDMNDEFIALGLWNSAVQIVEVGSGVVRTIEAGLSAPARTIVLSDILPGQTTLLVGARDGTLTTYTLSQGTAMDKKSVSLGTQPLLLFPLETLIFASSDRPTLLHLSPRPHPSQPPKLLLSALSVKDVLSLAHLDHPAYPDALIIATKEGLRIGKMDQMARLQVRSVGMPNGELPRRIARMETSGGGVVGVISLRSSVDVDGREIAEGFFRVYDEDSWQCIDCIRMEGNNLPQAVAACALVNVSTDEKKTYFVVGTAVEASELDEPKEGFVQVYEVGEVGGRLRVDRVVEIKVPGSVFCVDECDGKLVCGIGSTVRVYDLTHDNLSEIAIFGAPISALTLSIRPPFILLGDLMSSILLLRLDTSSKPELVPVSRDYSPLWMTSVAILDETWFLGAEDSGNLVGWRRDDDTGADEVRLGMVQEVRVGEMVNRVRLGEMGGGEVEGVECRALFATTEGTIGIFAALEEGRFVMLEKLERKMEEVDVALGGLDHARWRAFRNDRKKALRSKGFIDGDFVEGFLDLDAETRVKVCEGIPEGVEQVQKLVEELSRLH